MVRNVLSLYHRAYAGLPREIWMLSAALLINRSGTMVVPFLSLYLTSHLGYREATCGWILSAYGLGSIAGAYLGGRLTPQVGPIRLQIFALLLSVPLFLIVPLWQASVAIAVSMFLLALCSDAVRPASATAVSYFAPPELRVRAFGLQRMALNLGISFGPAIGGLLATVSFVWLFVLDAATTLLCALALMAFFGIRRRCPADQRQSASDPRDATGSPLRDAKYLLFLGLVLLAAIVFMQFHATYPLYLRDHYGLPKPAIGLMYSVNTVVIVLFEMLLLNVIRRWPPIRVVGWGGLFSCVGFGILPLGSSTAFCVFSMLIITVGEMLWMPLAMAWVAQRSEGRSRSMYMSYCTMTYAVASILAPIVGMASYQYHKDCFWYLSLGVGVIVFAGFHWLHRLLEAESQEYQPQAEHCGALET